MIVYKVVRVLPDGRLASATMQHPDFRLFYEVGKKACPSCGKILAFEDLVQAEKFLFLTRSSDGSADPTWRLYRAETASVEPCYALLDPWCYPERIPQFWEEPLAICEGMKMGPPQGTVGCPDLTLLEEVTP